MQEKRSAVEHYAQLAWSDYKEAVDQAKELQKEIKHFLTLAASKTHKMSLLHSFNKVKKTWIKARFSYGQTEIFRFYGGPIDFEEVDDGVLSYLESISWQGVEHHLNAWPVNEAYIDYIPGQEQSGLINNPHITIDKETLLVLNEQGGEENISTGWHVMEFLLWGRDTSEFGPGNRPHTDYIDGGSAYNQERRREYLNILSDLIVEHLTRVMEQWKPDEINYRMEFENKHPDHALAAIFTSLISMTDDELKNRRLKIPLLFETEEDGHSHFSDTTLNDIHANILGIRNVYLGNRETLSHLVSSVDSRLDLRIRKNLNETLYTIKQIPPPFEQAVKYHKKSISHVIDILETTARDFKTAAALLKLPSI